MWQVAGSCERLADAMAPEPERCRITEQELWAPGPATPEEVVA